MLCETREFGLTKSGEKVTEYTLTNKSGHNISLINYGGIMTKINVPDQNGQVGNVVLGFDTISEYEEKSPFFGCITGRVAGRITGAKFTIGDITYELGKNDGENNLHGGPVGLDKRIWSVSEVLGDTYGELVLNYVSEDMDQGFPGTLDIVVTYRFDDDDNLTLTYIATTDKETILTLTNHTYFNLSGDPSTQILNHMLTIPADKFVAVGPDTMPISAEATKNTPFDFTIAKAIGKDILADDVQLKNGGGYDHAFILNKKTDEKIILEDPTSGRRMEVVTDEACVVCYSANNLTDQDYVYNKKSLQHRSAVCLETQYYPDAINAKFFPSATLKPGEVYKHQTTFSFKAL